MSNILSSLRNYMDGTIDEGALNRDAFDDLRFEDDEEFMQECMSACLPTMVQMMIMDENAEMLDEATRDAFVKVNDYFVGQGLISEAATMKINNPKINVVHLNKQAQLNRLTTILTLKMARKDNSKKYQKYKLGQRIKKENLEDMKKQYGGRAERLAKKLFAKLQKSRKAGAVVTEAKSKIKK